MAIHASELLFDNGCKPNAQAYIPTKTQALYRLLRIDILWAGKIALSEHYVGRTIASSFQSYVSGRPWAPGYFF